MIEKLKEIWRNESPNLIAVCKQLAIPALIAALYGLWDWHSSKGNGEFSLAAYLKLTLPALFFIMWFVGLYERAKKRSADRDSFENISTGIQSLTDLVKNISTSPHAGIPTPASTSFGSSYSESLITEAFSIFSSGHKLAALLQAGTAFEQAVRAFARRNGLESSDQMPLLRILQKLDFMLPRGWEGEFHMLRQIRNRLTHASEEELHRIEQPEVILNTFALAIKALNESGDA